MSCSGRSRGGLGAASGLLAGFGGGFEGSSSRRWAYPEDGRVPPGRCYLFLPGLAVFTEAVCAECAHITVGCTAGRCYKWVPRVYSADTRVYGREEPKRSHTDQHPNRMFSARAWIYCRNF